MTTEEIKSDFKSVRLSSFNVDVRSKLAKFDADNQGELTVNDLTHAIITLQKQSNNYKRILYIILPIMVIMILSIFGTTILAINLTKEIKINGNGLLVSTTSNEVISTSQAVNLTSLQDWLSSENPNALKEIHAIEFPNMILPVQHVYVNLKNSTTTIVLEHMYMNINFIDETVEVTIKKIYEDDPYIKDMVDNIQNQMILSQKIVQKMSTGTPTKRIGNEKQSGKFLDLLLQLLGIGVQTQTRSGPYACASVKPACSPLGLCNPPPTK